MTNREQEELWVNAWNDLYEIINQHPESYLLIDEYETVTLKEALAWIQDAAYQQHSIRFTLEYYKGKKAILISQSPLASS